MHDRCAAVSIEPMKRARPTQEVEAASRQSDEHARRTVEKWGAEFLNVSDSRGAQGQERW